MSAYIDKSITDRPFFEILGFIPNPEFSLINRKEIVASFSLSRFEDWLEQHASDVLETDTDKERVSRQVKDIYLKLSGLIRDESGSLISIPEGEIIPLSRQEVSIFSACFGMPEDEIERKKWFTKNYPDRIAFVQNILGERTKATSFTRIK
jgi:hypothetical protein